MIIQRRAALRDTGPRKKKFSGLKYAKYGKIYKED